MSIREGYIDSAAVCFKEAYEARLKGTKFEVIPDILINLADATNIWQTGYGCFLVVEGIC